MTWRPPRPPFPAGEDAEAIADWAELTVAATGQPLGRGKLSTTAAREDVSATIVAESWSELERRAEVLRDLANYTIDAHNLSPRRRRAFGLNVFLTALSLGTNVDNYGRELFEHAVADLVTAITGTKGLRIGAPRRHPQPSRLNDAVQRYMQRADELSALVKPLPPTDQDLGLDVVSWWPFGDRRGGYLHLLGQCTTGADWLEKVGDLSVPVWRDHVSWAVEPVRFYAMPFIARPDKFRRVCREGGLIMDRPRLLYLNARKPIGATLQQKMRSYCDRLYG